MKKLYKYYIGCNKGDWRVFRSDFEPDRYTHGKLYAAVIGPFSNKHAADYMVRNRLCETVQDAEKLSALERANRD